VRFWFWVLKLSKVRVAAYGKDLRLRSLDMFCACCWTVLGEGMNRTAKLRAAVVLFLSVLLLGGTATLSVTAAMVTFVLLMVVIVILVVGSIVKSNRDKNRK
jgi:hypothetical protein